MTRSRGFTLIASLLLLLLLSGLAIGLMMMVNTENKVGGVDLQNNVAYHNAEGAVEKMTADLAATFKSVQAPKPADICALSSLQPVITGVTWKDYQVQPASGCTAPLSNNYGQIQSGPNQGLWAQIVPVTMLATAAQAGGQEVSMMRTAQVALIPVFQFGVFSDSDLGFYSSPDLNFAGRVHTNGDLYMGVANCCTLTFHDKITAYGNVVRQNLPNGLSASSYNDTGTVLIPTASLGCDGTKTACRPIGQSEGSVVGMGGNPPQSSPNTGWTNISLSTYNATIIDGNYGKSGGTGAKNLSLPFVNGTTLANEIIRRPPVGESATSALGASREYNLSQIHVLLSDDPAELPGGAADANNVRLANVPGNNQFGIATSTPAGLPALAAGTTYNTYFATASSAIPDPSSCTANSAAGPTCPPLNTSGAAAAIPFDWPLGPAAAPAGAQMLVPAGAPNLTALGAPAPAITLCPPANLSVAPPAGCPTSVPPYPYEVTANPDKAATWNMLDGYLRVEYKNAAGNWIPVTNEWLSLGFARGLTPPTAPGTNPVNPNAILILQMPADRNSDGALDVAGLAPVCTHTVASGANKGKCDQWNYGRPPEVVSDFLVNGAGSTSPFFGITNAATNVQSLSRNNWYPINFYDAREGEPRDSNAGNNSCTANGVMNAVEIDAGNLKRWLWGQIGASGTSVDFQAQNGWVLYFSDRRGMLPSPNAGNAKTGESLLEDTINSGSAAGAPDGVLDPKPTGKKFSPEDVNQNGLLDGSGAKNMGLGFYNGATNINAQILLANPDNSYTPRITSCGVTARKNWVSGARHVLKMVDGALGNVPLRTDNTGGFTVASENPVYIQGNYNSNAGDPVWAGGADQAGHAAATVIADAVTVLSNNWSDQVSLTGTPSDALTRPASTTYYRLAIAAGKNMNFPFPAWENGTNYGTGTDGGVHNFLRFLENWTGATLNYEGSLVSLYYSTYNTGIFKCCTYSVYRPPNRNYVFDPDFATPTGLPPGTPLFRDVDTLGYRQVFAVRDR